MVTIEALRPLTDAQNGALANMTARRCPHCEAGLVPVKMRGGRQYVHYDRDERRIVVCTEVRS